MNNNIAVIWLHYEDNFLIYSPISLKKRLRKTIEIIKKLIELNNSQFNIILVYVIDTYRVICST